MGTGCDQSPPNYSLSKNVLLVGKFSPQNTNFGAENPPFWGNFGAKLNFSVPVGNLQLPVPTFQPTAPLVHAAFVPLISLAK